MRKDNLEPQGNESRDIGDPNLPPTNGAGEGHVTRQSILCTEELARRPSRPPDHEKESRALIALAQALTDSPHTILQTLADTILELLQCDSAGISLLTIEDGGKRFYWPAIAGAWKPHIGGGTPRDFGPCGDVLDCNAPLMFKHIERFYTYFQPVTPAVEECLLVPFYVQGKAVGTIWAVAHDQHRKFDAEDMRQLQSLSRFASAAYQGVLSLGASQRLAAIVESSDDAIISKDLNAVITSWNDGAERIFGYTAQEAVGRPVTMLMPPERVDEEAGILERIRRGERIDHYETVRRRKDGMLVDISLTVSPVLDPQGRVMGASKIARDISSRKQAEKNIENVKNELEARVLERTRELRNQVQENRRAEENLRNLTARLLQVQDEERRHMARDLHDSAGQLLTALNMSISSALTEWQEFNPQTRATSLVDSLALVDQISKEIRTLSHLLHPPLLDELGLSTAVRWYVDGFAERSKIDINLDMPENFDRLTSDQEIALFRVIQECLTNIHRHSGSPKAAIRIARQGGRVCLEIRDEGKGIPLEKRHALDDAQPAGVGLRGMRERLRQLGGNLEIQSSERGTFVTATLPVENRKMTAADN
jgi:PAS domain S-box-containing protein